MNANEISEFPCDLLIAHGLNASRYKDWVLVDGDFPAIAGDWIPIEDPRGVGQLNITVMLEDRRVIAECFGGYAEGTEGCKSALEGFVRGDFHALLSALWGHVEPGQVEIEDWETDTRTWKAHLGRYVVRCMNEFPVEIPQSAFPTIERAIRAEALGPGPHWVRTFAWLEPDGEKVFEALLDNEVWEKGVEALAETPWQDGGAFYSVRNFLVLTEIERKGFRLRPPRLSWRAVTRT